MDSDATSALVVAIDGGGSKTACAVASYEKPRGWRVLGRGAAGASNASAVGETAALRAIDEASRQAHAEAGCQVGIAKRGVFALAGTLREDLRMSMQTGVESLSIASEVRVVPDLLPILYAASPTGEGVGIIAGTGSVGFARNELGELRVVGGWGYLLGDEGSGFWLGREALRGLLTRLAQKVPLGALDAAICQKLGASSSDGVKRVVYSSVDPRQLVAALARCVIELGEAPTPNVQATELLDRCAASLAQLVRDAEPHASVSESIAAAGGLLTASPTLLARLKSHLVELGFDRQLMLVRDPLEGCLALSRDPAFSQPLTVG